MSFFADLGHETPVAAGEHVRAIGWLHPDHAHTKGEVSTEFLARLKEFIRRPSLAGDDFCFPGIGGLHTCEFCGQAHGGGNLGLPSDNLLFIFPDMIVHYVEAHGYQPPAEFVAALHRSPFRDTEEFQLLSEPFWHLHKRVQEAGQCVAKFLGELQSIPWFRNLGKPLPADAAATQLWRWEDWPGPEDPAISELSERQQALYDDILLQSEGRREELSDLWDQVHQTVVALASEAVPYDPARDAWHAPTTAVWQAAWTAGLIAWSTLLRRPIPPELQEQWDWFVLGHWPAGYTVVWADGRRGPFLVY